MIRGDFGQGVHGVVCTFLDVRVRKRSGDERDDGESESESEIAIENGGDVGFRLSSRCRPSRSLDHGMKKFFADRAGGRIVQFYLVVVWYRSWVVKEALHGREIKGSTMLKTEAQKQGQEDMSSAW